MNLLEMQILGPLPRPTGSETGGAQLVDLTSSSGDSGACKSEKHWLSQRMDFGARSPMDGPSLTGA